MFTHTHEQKIDNGRFMNSKQIIFFWLAVTEKSKLRDFCDCSPASAACSTVQLDVASQYIHQLNACRTMLQYL